MYYYLVLAMVAHIIIIICVDMPHNKHLYVE